MIEREQKKIKAGVYKIVDLELGNYCDRLKLGDVVELEEEEVLRRVEREVYEVAVKLFESLEHLEMITGNGHHMAQRLASDAKELVQDRLK